MAAASFRTLFEALAYRASWGRAYLMSIYGGGGGGEYQIPPKVWSRAAARKILFGPSRGVRGMLPWKSLKMEPLRLAKNAFPAWS